MKIKVIKPIKKVVISTKEQVGSTLKKAKPTKKVKHFENALTDEHGIHYSRYIASWLNIYAMNDICPSIYSIYDDTFMDWLMQTGISEDEAYRIKEMATCGKMELESDAHKFLNK